MVVVVVWWWWGCGGGGCGARATLAAMANLIAHGWRRESAYMYSLMPSVVRGGCSTTAGGQLAGRGKRSIV